MFDSIYLLYQAKIILSFLMTVRLIINLLTNLT